MIKIIAAISKNKAIGYQNKLLYHIPEDLKRFKELTFGKTVVMGKNTYYSLPGGALPGRRNIVISSTVSELPGCECYKSLKDALLRCLPDEDIYIIGGARLYREALGLANELILTEIDDIPPEADTFFPEFKKDVWVETGRVYFEKDKSHPVSFSFVGYCRK